MKVIKNKLIYLASPYSHKNKKIMEQRFREVTFIAAELIRKGYILLTPITSSHEISRIGGKMPGSWKFWRRIDIPQLRVSDILLVAKMDGWKESTGVKAEIAYFKRHKKPIYYLNALTLEITREVN